MRHSQAQSEDFKLEAERKRALIGTARISLDVLYFQKHRHRELNNKHVDHLLDCFRRDRCRRLEMRNRISAEIDPQFLDAVLHDSGVNVGQLRGDQPNGYPWLVFPRDFQLECFNGQHRIKAARSFLLPADKWWVVDLYNSDISHDLRIRLNEEHSNEDQPSDGEAYCKIRYYHFQRDIQNEMRWKSSLRGCRLKNLNELLRDEELTAGFDALLDIPGIWDGMMLTTLQKMMAMGSRHEVLNYLRHIKQVFVQLVGESKDAMAKIDKVTVQSLEQRAPGASAVDAQFLRTKLRGGEIFSAFTDHERDEIWGRLQMVDGLIPSLFTFFRDIQYLKLCIDCLKRLVHVPRRESVCKAIQKTYTSVNQTEGYVKIQVTEGSMVTRTGSSTDNVDLGFRQLVAMAMRHYPNMPAESIRGDPVQKASGEADSSIVSKLATLAYELGFESDQIHSLKQDQGLEITEDGPHLAPFLVTSGGGVLRSRRSGIPRRGDYIQTRPSLYISHLHDKQRHHGEEITAFFVRKSVYCAFFGIPTNDDHEAARASQKRVSTSGLSSSPSGPSPARFSEQPNTDTFEINSEHMEDVDEILSSYARGRNDIPIHDYRDVDKDTSGVQARESVLHEPGESTGEDQTPREEQSKVLIDFIHYERGTWRVLPPVEVSLADSSEIERVAQKYARKGIRTLDTELRILCPKECFQAVIDDGSHTILLVAQSDLDINNGFIDSVSELHKDARERVIGLKKLRYA